MNDPSNAPQLANFWDNCASHNKPEIKINPLKSCAKRKSTSDCSHDCQNADRKARKKSCTQQAQGRAERLNENEPPLASLSSGAPAQSPTEQPPEIQIPGIGTRSIPEPSDAPENLAFNSNEKQFLAVKVSTPFSKLKERKWLHGRTKEDVYKLLIDTYRLRLDDDSKLHAFTPPGSIYDIPIVMYLLASTNSPKWPNRRI